MILLPLSRPHHALVISFFLSAAWAGGQEATPKSSDPLPSPVPAAAPAAAAKAAPPEAMNGLPLIFSEDFEKGRDRWEVTDEKSWTHRMVEGNSVFGINRRESDYVPTHRSPLHIAMIKGVKVEDFILTFRVRSTRDTGAHRDCCIFFNHQDATHFYYAHLGAKPDPASGQIMIVDGAPRKPITENLKPVPWTDQWHEVKVVRDSSQGTIRVYFDNMDNPLLEAVDRTFGKGGIGIGSFDDMNDFDDIRLYGK